ncbi:cytochrome o ubiquinol oxidase subunit 2 [Cohnella sp. OV330]|uniref:ubiquinol oxidase subunit II n=1 Tax=Cohnella sp. OV330 TaxID=1855288 RepID=UPI0008E1E344|nr:ubiquinol oxidase subunit II [Cohnella sp. OV330]SFB46750.1 cytochrome o ubiquinol oxidase subunit 2 [Cohnella sp. OV330]
MKYKGWFMRAAAFLPLALMTFLLSGCADVVVLNPKGEIAKHQLDLIYITTGLCLIIIVPVLILTFWIAWKYRAKSKKKEAYQPEWDHSTKLEAVWWGIPILIILLIAIVTVQYSYKLEPSKALASDEKPITIQVVALDWKWLFLYPEQGIATVNYVQFPEKVPVQFQLTADAPMNSFWIPQLGGQIYTMSGMAMKLHLIADEPGDYFGTGANFSGEYFGKMTFNAKATSRADFDKWVQDVKQSYPAMSQEGYNELAQPATSLVRSFSAFPNGMFDNIVNKYVVAGQSGHHHGGDAASSNEGADVADGQAGHDMSEMDMSEMDMSDAGDSGAAHQH